jgi:hypothetical protein
MRNAPRSIIPLSAPPAVPRQLSITFGFIPVQGMSQSERKKAISCLACLLMQAADIAAGEHDDDER